MIRIIQSVDVQISEDDMKHAILLSGDQIVIKLKNGDDLNLTIGHDQRGNTFAVFRDLATDIRCMNENDTNRCGWRDCDMRKYAKEFEKLLPDSFLGIIKPYHIVQQIRGSRIECDDNVFCLSMTQVFGNRSWWKDIDPEDSQLDIFKSQIGRMKTCRGGVTPYSWWARSPSVSISTNFCLVSSTGTGGSNLASYSNGVCFGFCLNLESESQSDEEPEA